MAWGSNEDEDEEEGACACHVPKKNPGKLDGKKDAYLGIRETESRRLEVGPPSLF